MYKLLNLFKSITLSTNQLVFFTCVYLIFILNIPFLAKTSTEILALEEYNVFFLLSVPFFILSLAITIQCFFAFRWITKPLLILLVLLSRSLLGSGQIYRAIARPLFVSLMRVSLLRRFLQRVIL